METETIQIIYHSKDIEKLERIGEKSDWIDLRCSERTVMKQGEWKLIPLGVSMKLPEGYEAYVVPRSSTYKTWGLLQTNSCGIIDHSYCGTKDEWKVPMLATRDTVIEVNDRICQFRIMKSQPAIRFEEVESLDEKSRGGFGSTGRNAVCMLLLSLLLIIVTGCSSDALYTKREEAVKAFQAGQYEQARELFEEALSYGNGEVSDVEFDILRYRAECELRLRDYEAAEKTYGILMELDPSPENQDLYNGLQEQFDRVREINEAFSVMQQGDYEKAYAAMDQFAGLGGDTTEAMAWFNKAVCAEYLGNWEEARQLFEDYLAVYPEDAEAQKEYAFLKTR